MENSNTENENDFINLCKVIKGTFLVGISFKGGVLEEKIARSAYYVVVIYSYSHNVRDLKREGPKNGKSVSEDRHAQRNGKMIGSNLHGIFVIQRVRKDILFISAGKDNRIDIWNRDFSTSSHFVIPGTLDCLYIPTDNATSNEDICFVGVCSIIENNSVHSLYVFDLNTLREIFIANLESRPVAISYRNDGNILVVSCRDKNVYFFQHRESGFVLVDTYASSMVITTLLFCGDLLIMAGRYTEVLCMSMTEGEVMSYSFNNQNIVNIHIITIQHKSKLLIITADGSIQRCDIETFELEKCGQCNRSVSMTCVYQNRLGHWLLASVIKQGMKSVISLIDAFSFDKKGSIPLKGDVTAIQSIGKKGDKGDYLIVAYRGGNVFSYNMSD